MGHVPLELQLLSFCGHFKAVQTLPRTLDNGCIPRKNILAYYSFVTGYCMSFVIFFVRSLSFVPLLAPNYGNATANITGLGYIAYNAYRYLIYK